MIFDIITIFPGFFDVLTEFGVTGRALKNGIIRLRAHDLRDYTEDRHRTTDDSPYGGGCGMVMKVEPLARAIEAIAGGPGSARKTMPVGIRGQGVEGEGGVGGEEGEGGEGGEKGVGGWRKDAGPVSGGYDEVQPPWGEGSGTGTPGKKQGDGHSAGGERPGGCRVILTTPQGEPFTQALARDFSSLDRLVILCGRYEGVDERIGGFVDMEVSIGDYVLSGGEIPALVIIDAVSRLVPGVLGSEKSGAEDSFSRGLLGCPQYTRPAEFRGHRVPEVLLSGDHARIERYRKKEALRRTLEKRPDLIESVSLTDLERELFEEIRSEKKV